jgi:hypothetical protein
VVEVRLIKGKIDHPPIFKKIRYFSDPDRVFRLGSQKYHNTRRFLCKKNGRKMLGNNFKTILKEERWSKLPTFTEYHYGILFTDIIKKRTIFLAYSNAEFSQQLLHKLTKKHGQVKSAEVVCDRGQMLNYTYILIRKLENVSKDLLQSYRIH